MDFLFDFISFGSFLIDWKIFSFGDTMGYKWWTCKSVSGIWPRILKLVNRIILFSVPATSIGLKSVHINMRPLIWEIFHYFFYLFMIFVWKWAEWIRIFLLILSWHLAIDRGKCWNVPFLHFFQDLNVCSRCRNPIRIWQQRHFGIIAVGFFRPTVATKSAVVDICFPIYFKTPWPLEFESTSLLVRLVEIFLIYWFLLLTGELLSL